jgi:hypothetical protein
MRETMSKLASDPGTGQSSGMRLLMLFALFASAGAADLVLPGGIPHDAAAWAPRRVALREAWTKFLGSFPAEKAPLAPRWLGDAEALDGYTRRKVSYTIEPGIEMDAVLFLPAKTNRAAPGVVVFHPTLKAHYAQFAGYDESRP